MTQFCLYSSWIPLSFVLFSHSSHTASTPFVPAPRMKTVPNLLLPLALSSVAAIKDVSNPVDVLYHVCSTTNSLSFWLVSLWSQRLSGPRCVQLAWLRELGQLGSLTTRITVTHSQTDINRSSRQAVFHLQPCANLSKFPVITPIVVSYLDTKQSFSKILDFL